MSTIGTRIYKGQGMGNRLFAYVSTRALAKRLNYDFVILDSKILENGLKDSNGVPFMVLNFGRVEDDMPEAKVYGEKNDRLYLGNSGHDMTYGADVSGTDYSLLSLSPETLIDGILQSPEYFNEYKDDIKQWLAVKPEYDSNEFTADDLCIINIRGREYAGAPELFLRRKYWKDAMTNMRHINPDMRFMVITDDVASARRVLPEVPAFHFEVWKDYVTVKNARYLILSNSSFAFFPAYTSETAKFIIAPKYWARHNVSDGYWCAEQNIYDEFNYQDRRGKLFTAEECRKELEEYKRKSSKYKRLNKQLRGIGFYSGKIRCRYIKVKFWIGRILLSMKRRIIGKTA